MANSRDRLMTVLRRAGPLVTLADIEAALHVSRIDASKIASRWARQGHLVRLRQGLYAPVPMDSSADAMTLEEPWQIIPQLFAPGFVTGWSAAEHWHLTEQLFRRICVKTAVEVRRKVVAVGDVEFFLTHVNPAAVFGTQVHWAGKVRVQVADPHKTVLDMLDDPSLGGGARHMSECVRAYFGSEHADTCVLLEYAERLSNGAVFKRLGFLAESALGEGAELVSECRRRLTTGYAKLDPNIDCPRIVTRWRLRVPPSWVEGSSS